MWFASHTCFVPRILGIECDLFFVFGPITIAEYGEERPENSIQNSTFCVGNSYLVPRLQNQQSNPSDNVQRAQARHPLARNSHDTVYLWTRPH
jgi:hypothetical protein